MGITAESGPFIAYGITQTSTGAVAEYNEERGPSLFDLGHGTLDPRYQFNYDPGNPVGTKVYGIYGQRAEVDYVPITAQTSAIAISSNNSPTAGGALTLTPAASSIGTYNTTIIAPETLKVTGTLLAIDSTAAYLAFGTGNQGGLTGTSTSGTVAIWNPAAGTGRAVQINGQSSLDTGSWTVSGRDMYGFKMTETLLMSDGSTNASLGMIINGHKAFKYISGVTASSSCTFTSTGVGVGFQDVFGLPLLVKYTGVDLGIRLIATSSLQYGNSSGPVTLGTTVATALVSSGPDVRGTYASTTASNGTIRFQFIQNITANMVNSISASDTSAMFGGTQFSSV